MTRTLTSTEQSFAEAVEMAAVGAGVLPCIRIGCETVLVNDTPIVYVRGEVHTSNTRTYGAFTDHNLALLMQMPYAQMKAKVRESVATVQRALVEVVARECSGP